MIRSIDEEEDIENSFNLVLRNNDYKKEIYQINEEIKHNKNMNKLYGYNKERNLNVVITKIMNISLEENKNFEKRLLITIKLIEENKLLVENLWIEKSNSNKYTLFISELTNSIYRNEFNLITLNNYMNSIQNTYKENIEILISIVEQMLYFNSINFAHLNIHPNNIYINTKKNNSIYFGPPKLVKNFTYDCTYLWYSGPEESYQINEIWENNTYGYYNDIWSLGCIICEMFFINFPLFQSYSPNEKIMKIFEILGFPEYEEVDFMNEYQYESLAKKSMNNSKENNLVEFLLSSKEEEHSNLYNFKIELIDIINGCLGYSRVNRITLDEILKKLEYLNNNISSEFQSKITNTTFINSEESEYKNTNNNNNKYKIIQNNNNLIESEEDNDIENNEENTYNNENMINNEINLINKYNYNYDSIKNNSKNNISNQQYSITISNNNNSKIRKNISLNDEEDNKDKKLIKYYDEGKESKKSTLEEKNKNKELNNKNKDKIKSKKIVKEKNEYEELQKSKLYLINYFHL